MSPTAKIWHTRAEQARRVILDDSDAQRAEDYAADCEYRARCLSAPPGHARYCETCPLAREEACL